MIRALLPGCLAASLVLFAAPALASEASKLFEEGVKLLDQGRIAEACPKLELSQRLEPAAGTQLNLAACYEKSGKKMLALETFRAASEAARARGRADWQRVADEHIADLAASLPALTIAPTDPRGELEIHIDDKLVRDSSLVVEPGVHTVVVSSAGKKPYTVKVDVTKSTVVAIPALERTPPVVGASLSPPPPAPPSGPSARQIVGIGVGATGVGAIVFAGVGAFLAASALDDAKSSCASYPSVCSPAADGPNQRAVTWSTISTIAGIAGLVLAAGGAALYFIPSKDSAQLGVRTTF